MTDSSCTSDFLRALYKASLNSMSPENDVISSHWCNCMRERERARACGALFFGEGGGKPAVLKAFQLGPYVLLPRAPPQHGRLACGLRELLASSPTSEKRDATADCHDGPPGLVLSATELCATVPYKENQWHNEERSDVASWYHLSEAVRFGA